MNTYNRKLTKLKPRNMGCHAQSTNEVSIFWCHIPNFPMLKKDKKQEKQKHQFVSRSSACLGEAPYRL